MKRTSTFIFFLVIVFYFINPDISHAQFTGVKSRKWHIGIKGGLIFSSYSNSNFDYKDGLMLGTFVNYRLSALPMAIQSEVLYTQKGADRIGTMINTEYVDVPLLAKFYIPIGAGLNFIPFAGSYIGFPLDGERIEGGVTADLSSSLNTDFGGVTGLEVKLNTGKINIIFEGRYSLGFTDVFDQINTLSDTKNSAITISVGFVY